MYCQILVKFAQYQISLECNKKEELMDFFAIAFLRISFIHLSSLHTQIETWALAVYEGMALQKAKNSTTCNIKSLHIISVSRNRMLTDSTNLNPVAAKI
jgi:hypothetical protein